MTSTIVVLGDTHLTPASKRDLPVALWSAIDAADLVLHTGDVTTPALLDGIAARTPVTAVLGNNDIDLDHLPERVELDIEGVRVAMVHDSGPTAGRANRMRRWFPTADIVLFGHSHAPVNEPGSDGQWLLNPGSPTQRRRQPVHTHAVLRIDGRGFEAEIVEI